MAPKLDLPADDAHPTRALLHLDQLTHNLRLLEELAGDRPLWPPIKANAYGHGADIVEAILQRRQSLGVTAEKLMRCRLPACWEQQRRLLGFMRLP